MTRNNYIGANGLVVQSLPEIREDLVTKFTQIYGEDVNLDQNTPDGQWLNILAQEKKDILDLFVQFYNDLDVDSVIGFPQQVLYKLNGLKIKAYTYSYVYVNVTVDRPVNLQGLDDNIENANATGFTVSDNGGNNWILAESQSLQAGTHLLNFRAEQLGNIQALTNTVNVMTTILPGVISVNNPSNNHITGGIGESTAEFRLRRNRTMAVASQGFEESIQSQLLNETNITQAKVYCNRKSTTEQGIPPHTVWVIVEGGDEDVIGRIIYNNIPPGIPMKGEQEVEITRINGETDTVNYDLPNAVNVYIKANIKRIGSTIIDTEFIKREIAKTTFNIGQAIESSVITNVMKNALQETGNPYDVEISLDESDWTNYLIPTGLADYFVIPVENIELNEVS